MIHRSRHWGGFLSGHSPTRATGQPLEQAREANL